MNFIFFIIFLLLIVLMCSLFSRKKETIVERVEKTEHKHTWRIVKSIVIPEHKEFREKSDICVVIGEEQNSRHSDSILDLTSSRYEECLIPAHEKSILVCDDCGKERIQIDALP